jgi:hypothetical protein
MIDPKYTAPHSFPIDPSMGFADFNTPDFLAERPEDSHLYEGMPDDVQSTDVDKKDLTAESVPVNVITLHSLFMNCLSRIRSSIQSADHALESWKKIKLHTDKFGPVPLFTDFLDTEKKTKSVYSQLWVNVPQMFSPSKKEFYLNFRIDRGPFESQYLEDSTNSGTFNYLSIYEDEEPNPFIYLRLGNAGEILWLSKGDHLAGKSVKNLCLKLLETIPLIPTSYLLDAATINLRVKGKKTMKVEKVVLSMILALSSENGESWYGRSGFSPVKCSQEKIKGGVVTQDPDVYYQAVEKLRTITFDQMKELFGKYHVRCHLLESCVRANFQEKASPSLHAIFQAVHMQTKKYQRNTPESIQAETNLFKLYNFFLNPESLKIPSANKQMNLYFLALETLKGCIVWRRGFMEDSINLSYERFLKYPHGNFDASMDEVADNRPLNWKLPSTLSI